MRRSTSPSCNMRPSNRNSKEFRSPLNLIASPKSVNSALPCSERNEASWLSLLRSEIFFLALSPLPPKRLNVRWAFGLSVEPVGVLAGEGDRSSNPFCFLGRSGVTDAALREPDPFFLNRFCPSGDGVLGAFRASFGVLCILVVYVMGFQEKMKNRRRRGRCRGR